MAEEPGFDSGWVMDHYEQIPGSGSHTDPMLESYTLLIGSQRARDAPASARWSAASLTATPLCSPRS